MRLEPFGDRIIVEKIEDGDEKRYGSLIIPDIAREQPTMGRVLATGPGAPVDGGRVRPTGVEVGDVVMFGKYSGTDMEFDGQELLFLRAADIMCRVPPALEAD